MYAHIVYLKGRRNVDMRKEAERLGLRVGKKIKHIRRRVNGEDNDYIRKGRVEGLYPQRIYSADGSGVCGELPV